MFNFKRWHRNIAFLSVAILVVLTGLFLFSTFKTTFPTPTQTIDGPKTEKPTAHVEIDPLTHKAKISPIKADFNTENLNKNSFSPRIPPQGKAGVIRAVDNNDNAWKGYNDAGIRSRAVKLDNRMFADSIFREGTELSLELFDDLKVDATVTDSLRNVNGTISTTAKIKGSPFGRIFIASTDGEVHARIRDTDNQKIYAIQYNHNTGNHYALELDIALAEPDEGNDIVIDPPALADEPVAAPPVEDPPPIALGDEASDEYAVIDVMVVYTDDALTAAGSQAAMDNNIALAVAMANDAHDNTGTFIVWFLVHSYELVYSETGNMNTDLTFARTDSTIATNRTTYGADFVQFINNIGSGGIASLLTSSSGSSSTAFSVVDDGSLVSYTPVHEVGHNMGLHHAKDQNYQWGPTPWSPDAYGFGTTTAGWHWHPTPSAAGYCTVMTYTGSSYFGDGLAHTRIGYFSDPNINDPNNPSFPIGDAADGDSAKVLRQLRHVYAAYKSRLSGTVIQVDYPNGGETLTEGSTYNILWDSSNVTGEVKIELYKDGSLDSVIDADTLNDRAYAWTVPGGKSGFGYTIRISDVNTGAIVDTSNATFNIDTAFYNEPLNSNPGYTATGNWEYGIPVAIDNVTYGGPGTAYTGTNIYDTDLDYVCFSDSNLTTLAIDCSNYVNVNLKFMGQFSVTDGDYAKIQVSNNGSTWTDLYSATNLWATSWSTYTYDISSYADYKSTVYIRWAYDDGGGSSRSGMSVDDITLTGISVTPHSADGDNDWSISQTEVETFITAYSNNSNTATTANGDITAGRITMREVMRVIYLYNGGGAYIAGQSTVDTYDQAGVSDPPVEPPPAIGDPPLAQEAADTIAVSNNADSGAGSLRNAIAIAGDGETIIIDGSVDTITLASEIVIDKSLTIEGNGVAIVSGDKQTRIFRVENTERNINVVLQNMGIVDATNATDEFGGAVYNNSQTLTLDTVLFDGNANSTETGKGGAVYSSGALNVNNCVFQNNTASDEDDVYSENGDVN